MKYYAPPIGIQSFCRDIVEVADLLEKVDDRDGVQQLTQYMAHIQARLQTIFTKHGLEKMSPVGSTYDPYQHEIVCHTPAEGVEPGNHSCGEARRLHAAWTYHPPRPCGYSCEDAGALTGLSCLGFFLSLSLSSSSSLSLSLSLSMYDTVVLTSLENDMFDLLR